MAFTVGEIRAQLAAELDSRGFKAFDAEMDKARAKADRGITANVRADVDQASFARARAETQGLSNDFNLLGRTMTGLRWAAITTGVGGAVGAIGALSAGVTGLVASLGAASGAAIPAFAQGLSLIGQVFGVVKLATEGVSGALSAYETQEKSATNTARTAASTATSSAEARKAAAQSVTSAQQSLADADRNVTQAQKQLTLAVQAGERQMVDLRRAAIEAGTSQKQAALNLAQARQALQKGIEQGVGGLQLRQLELSVTEAQQAYRDAQIQNTRAQQDYNKAQQEGVRGLPSVVAARRSLADAERTAARASAQLGYQQQQAALHMKQASASMNAAAKSANTFQRTLATLPAAQQQFVKFLIQAKTQLDGLREVAGKNLFPGVEAGITAAMKNLPVFRDLIAKTASALGGVADKFGHFLGSGFFAKFAKEIGGENVRLIHQFGTAMDGWAHSFARIAEDAQPLIRFLGNLTVRLSKTFDAFTASRKGQRDFTQFFADSRRAISQLLPLLGHLGVIFGDTLRAAFPLGQWLLKGLNAPLGDLAKFLSSSQGRSGLRDFFNSAKQPLSALGGLLSSLGGDIIDLFKALEPVVAPVAHLLSAVGDGIVKIVRPLAPVLSAFAKGLEPAVPALVKLGQVLARVFAILTPAATRLLVDFARTLADLSPVLIPIAKGLAAVANGFNALFRHVAPLRYAIEGLGGALAGIFVAKKVVGALTSWYGSVKGFIAKVIGLFGGAGDAAATEASAAERAAAAQMAAVNRLAVAIERATEAYAGLGAAATAAGEAGVAGATSGAEAAALRSGGVVLGGEGAAAGEAAGVGAATAGEAAAGEGVAASAGLASGLETFGIGTAVTLGIIALTDPGAIKSMAQKAWGGIKSVFTDNGGDLGKAAADSMQKGLQYEARLAQTDNIRTLLGDRAKVNAEAKKLGIAAGAGLDQGTLDKLASEQSNLHATIVDRIRGLKLGQEFAKAIYQAKDPVQAATKGLANQFDKLNNDSRRTFFSTVKGYVSSMEQTGQITRKQGNAILSYWDGIRRREARQWDQFVRKIETSIAQAFTGLQGFLQRLAFGSPKQRRAAENQAASAAGSALGTAFGLLGVGGGAHGGLVTPDGIVPLHLQTGGVVFPGSPQGTDTVPAWLTPGEGVVKAAAMRNPSVASLVSQFNALGSKPGDDERKLEQQAETDNRRHAKALHDDFITAAEKTRTDLDDSQKKMLSASRKNLGSLHDDALAKQNDLHDQTNKSWADLLDAVSGKQGAMLDSTQTKFSGMAQAAKNQGGKLSDAVSGSMNSAAGAVFKGMSYVAKATNQALKALGVKQIDFSIPSPSGKQQGSGSGGGGGKGGSGGGHGNQQGAAKGGRIEGRFPGGAIPGYSTVDDTLIMVRGGERVLRPEDQFPMADFAMRATFGTGLDDMLRSTGGIGYRLGGLVQRFAAGGKAKGVEYALPWPGGTSQFGELDRGIDVGGTGPVFAMDSGTVVRPSFNLFSTYGSSTSGLVYRMDHPPKGFPPSSAYVYIYELFNPQGPGAHGGRVKAGELLGHIMGGTGIEMGWAANASGQPLADALGEDIAARHSLPRGLPTSISLQDFIRAIQSGKHIASGAAGATVKKIAAPTVAGPKGALRTAAQAALDKATAAANTYLQKHAPARATGAGASANLPPGAAKGSVAKQFAAAVRATKAGPVPALALFEAGLAESGMGSASSNVLQLTGSMPDGSSPSSSPAVQAMSFLLRAYGLRTGAIPEHAAHPSEKAYQIAQEVQASGAGQASDGASNYGPQKRAAEAIMRQQGLSTRGLGAYRLGGLVPRFARGGDTEGAGDAKPGPTSHAPGTYNNPLATPYGPLVLSASHIFNGPWVRKHAKEIQWYYERQAAVQAGLLGNRAPLRAGEKAVSEVESALRQLGHGSIWWYENVPGHPFYGLNPSHPKETPRWRHLIRFLRGFDARRTAMAKKGSGPTPGHAGRGQHQPGSSAPGAPGTGAPASGPSAPVVPGTGTVVSGTLVGFEQFLADDTADRTPSNVLDLILAQAPELAAYVTGYETIRSLVRTLNARVRRLYAQIGTAFDIPRGQAFDPSQLSAELPQYVTEIQALRKRIPRDEAQVKAGNDPFFSHAKEQAMVKGYLKAHKKAKPADARKWLAAQIEAQLQKLRTQLHDLETRPAKITKAERNRFIKRYEKQHPRKHGTSKTAYDKQVAKAEAAWVASQRTPRHWRSVLANYNREKGLLKQWGTLQSEAQNYIGLEGELSPALATTANVIRSQRGLLASLPGAARGGRIPRVGIAAPIIRAPQFARGGVAGGGGPQVIVVPVPPPDVHVAPSVHISDPVLSALDPQIRTVVKQFYAAKGEATHMRLQTGGGRRTALSR